MTDAAYEFQRMWRSNFGDMLDEALGALGDRLGIGRAGGFALTAIEMVRLRVLLRESIHRSLELVDLYRDNQIGCDQVINPGTEAASLWACELYGLDLESAPTSNASRFGAFAREVEALRYAAHAL